MRLLLTILLIFVASGLFAQSTTIDLGVKFFQGKKAIENSVSSGDGLLRFEFADKRSFDKIFVKLLYVKSGNSSMEEMGADEQEINIKSFLSEAKAGDVVTVEFQKLEKGGAKFRLAKNKYTFTLQ